MGAGGPLVAGRLVSAALTFSLPLVLARLLSPEAFGTYKQFFLIASTLLLTGQLGLTQSIYYFVPRGGRERGAYVAQTVLSLSGLGVLFGMALFWSAPLLGRWVGDGQLATLRAPLALFGGLMLAASPLEGTLLSEGRIGKAALVYVLSDGLRALALVLGARYGGPAGLFWAAAGMSAARYVAYLSLLAVRLLPYAPPSWRLFRAQLAYALPFAGASYLYVGQRYFSQYAVSARFDAATFALFAVASFHMPVVDIVFSPLADVMMVELGREAHHSERRWEAWNGTVQKLATLLFPAACCAWLFGATLLPLLFTHKYDASVPLFMLVTIEIPFWVFPLDALLRAAGDTRFLFWFNGVRILFTAALVLGGIHLFGLVGAILGGVVSEALARVGMLLRGRHFLAVAPTRLVDWTQLSRTALAALGACLPAWGARLFPLPPLAEVALGGLVYACGYFGLLALWSRRRALSPTAAVA